MQQAQSSFSQPALLPKITRSTLVSRNVTVAGHRTSVRLEPDMWSGLSEIGRRERASLHEICTSVAEKKPENSSLTAAIRVFVMAYYRVAATEDGHAKAGHGRQGVLGGAAPSPPAMTSQTMNMQVLQVADRINGNGTLG